MDIKEEMLKAIAREETEMPEGIHVTSLVYDCMRRGYYDNTHEESFFDLKTLLTFWIGRAVHKTPILSNHEMTLKWGGIVGTLDEFQDGIIIDKKTTTYMPKSPNAHHARQIEYYAVLLWKNGLVFKEGYLVYIDINNKDIEVFPVKTRPLPIVEAEMMKKKTLLEEAIKNNIPPKREIGWICNYCSYASICFKEKEKG